ncbi:MAG: hypothetical protein KKD44_26515 [Proteobacteria bacterium]|nr:hypothetical protein [Pseudomonadota bacterium]
MWPFKKTERGSTDPTEEAKKNESLDKYRQEREEELNALLKFYGYDGVIAKVRFFRLAKGYKTELYIRTILDEDAFLQTRIPDHGYILSSEDIEDYLYDINKAVRYLNYEKFKWGLRNMNNQED